jgi:hypothetical protein
MKNTQLQNEKEERSLAAKFLGRIGGTKSAEKRLGGLTKEERSELMRKVRLSPKQREEVMIGLQAMVDNLNNNVAISLTRSKKK